MILAGFAIYLGLLFLVTSLWALSVIRRENRDRRARKHAGDVFRSYQKGRLDGHDLAVKRLAEVGLLDLENYANHRGAV